MIGRKSWSLPRAIERKELASGGCVRRGRPRGGIGLVFAAALTMSCAHTHTTVTADALLGEVFDNQIAALEKYKGESVIVTGRVEATGLKDFEKTVLEFTREYGSWDGSARNETHQRAFVSLKSDEAIPGNVVCFFSDDNRSGAAAAREGEILSLRGSVYRVKRRGNFAIVLMDACETAK
jgi:hypothetical protein